MRLEHTLLAGWKTPEFPGWPDRTPDEFAAAIRAGATEFSFCAGMAECAFERADQRIRRAGRQVAITAFAVGAESEHGRISSS